MTAKHQYPPCIFCGNTDSKPSREHVFPTWIAKEFPETLWYIKNLVTGTSFNARDNLGLISRKPCTRCNNGWMSALEREAKPILVPLMKGISSELSIEQQFVIIRWFVKTVMTHELTGDIPHFFKPNERKAIMDNAVMIEADALIFLARHVGSQVIRSRTYYIPLLVGHDADRPVGAEGYTTTFAFKNLVLQIFAVRRPPHLSDSKVGVNLRGNWDTATVQIWPISGSITWPPPFFFDDTGFELFINRWSKLTTPP